MVTLDAKTAGRLCFHPAAIAAEALEHELDHVTLAVIRRRRVGKNEQFHLLFAIDDIRFTRRRHLGILNRKSAIFNPNIPSSTNHPHYVL